MKSIIIYTLTTAPVSEPELYTKVGPVWIRHELFDGPVGEALDAASTKGDEFVSNTHPLPEPVRYRLLGEGETVLEDDEEQDPDDLDVWAPQRVRIGGRYNTTDFYPIRRALKFYVDAY